MEHWGLMYFENIFWILFLHELSQNLIIQMMVSRLTFNGVVRPEGHLNVIPFQETTGAGKRLCKHNILVCTKGESFHWNGLKLERLVGGKLWGGKKINMTQT